MCERKNCSNCGNAECSCLSGGMAAEDQIKDVIYLYENIVNMAWELEYSSLHDLGGCRLCLLGTCRRCGGRLCFELHVTEGLDCDDFLAESYRHIYQCSYGTGLRPLWREFREMFVRLFHQEDQPFIRAWLARPENQNIPQMYRRKKKSEESNL